MFRDVRLPRRKMSSALDPEVCCVLGWMRTDALLSFGEEMNIDLC